MFPQQPQLLHDLTPEEIAEHRKVVETGQRHWPASRILGNMRGWMFPYFKSLILPGDFQPIITAQQTAEYLARQRNVQQGILARSSQKTPQEFLRRSQRTGLE